jgi:phosphatidylglycerol---prolipoprotein diacylglyceryl transferase
VLNDFYHSLDPVLFTIGPFSVRWYGLAYVAGFIVAGFIIWRIARRWRVRFNDDALMTIMLCAVVGILLGARLGYCLFYGNGYYLTHPLEILAFNQGGMSFHGGLVGGLLSGIIAAKLTGIPYLTLADIAVIGAPWGLFFGRCANFINGELWGAVTDLPWGVAFGGDAGTVMRHPTQLYEAFLEGIVIFVVLFALSRKQPPRSRGTFLGLFLVMYGCFRFAIEFVRQPDAQLGYLFGTGWVTMGQLLSLPLIIAGISILVYTIKVRPPQQGLPEQEEA